MSKVALWKPIHFTNNNSEFSDGNLFQKACTFIREIFTNTEIRVADLFLRTC